VSDGAEFGGALSAEDLREGAIFAGRFRIERRLGKGGMGIVVAARHMSLDAPVAIKLLLAGALGSPEAVARFIREARATVRLRSEHVARIIDVAALPSGEPYVVMEYLSGHDLAAVLETRGPLPVRDALDYVIQACDGIAEAHALGIVHRDLKPANLFLTHRPDGSPLVKVLDFGVAKAPQSGDSAELTGAHTMLGSPLYMSPEQIVSARNVDSRTDVWALGAILYELVCGRPPFTGTTLQELGRRILTEKPRPPTTWRPDLPGPVAAAILECLTRDPSQRMQNVGELVEALAPFASSESVPLVGPIKRVLGFGVRINTVEAQLPVGVFPSRDQGGTLAAPPPPPTAFATGDDDRPTVRAMAAVVDPSAASAPDRPTERSMAAAVDAFASTAESDRVVVAARPAVAPVPVADEPDPTAENQVGDSARRTREEPRRRARRLTLPLVVGGLSLVALAAGAVGVFTAGAGSPGPTDGPRAAPPDPPPRSGPVVADAGVRRAPVADGAGTTTTPEAKANAATPSKRPPPKPAGRPKPPERKAPAPAQKTSTPYSSRR
jgi:eukaryotic-like serine/threonine-protein kinase